MPMQIMNKSLHSKGRYPPRVREVIMITSEITSELLWKLGDVIFLINLILVLVVVVSGVIYGYLPDPLLVFIPVLGFLFYVFWGKSAPGKAVSSQEEEERIIRPLLARQDASLQQTG